MARLLKSRAGAAKLGTPLMIVCFAAMGGFIYWLSISAKSSEEMAAEAEAPPAEDDRNLVPFADFSMNPGGYDSVWITLVGVPVDNRMGANGFWTSLQDTTTTNTIPYLVNLGPDALADSLEFASGDLVTVTGMTAAMSDSVLDAWEAAGAFTQETDRFTAEFAEAFLEAIAIEMHVDSAAASDDPPEPSS